jgi:alanine transaminase
MFPPIVLSSKGSYTHSQGLLQIRKHIADFIAKRDGYPSDPSNIFMTNGGAVAIQVRSYNTPAELIAFPERNYGSTILDSIFRAGKMGNAN